MALLLKADRDTLAIRNQIGQLARGAGGRYVAKAGGWDFNDVHDAFDQASALKATEKAKRLERQPDLGLGTAELPAKASVNSFVEDDQQFYVLADDSIATQLREAINRDIRDDALDSQINRHAYIQMAADGRVTERDDKSLLFTQREDFDRAVADYNTILRTHRARALDEAMQTTPGVNISHDATYAIHGQIRALGGEWVRTSAGGFWNFKDQEKGAQAQTLLTEFLAQPPSITDPNAIYCRSKLKDLGWYGPADLSLPDGPKAWRFPTDEALTKANALVADARTINPNGELYHNIFLVASLGVGNEAFGFDPQTQPERLAYLDRYSAVEAMKTAKTLLAERGVDLDREVRDAKSHPTVRAAHEIVAGAAARATLLDDKPRRSPANYEAEYDETAILRVTGQEGAALLRSVREQLDSMGVNTGSLKLHLATPDTQLSYTVGPIVATSEHYLVQRVDSRDEHGQFSMAYAVHERGRLRGRLADDNDLVNATIAAGTTVGIAIKAGHLLAQRLSASDPSELESKTTFFLTEVKRLKIDVALDPTKITRDENERSTLIAAAMPKLQIARDQLASERERVHLARQREAELAGRSFIETLRLPPPLRIVSSQTESDILHGKIIGDYGQKIDRNAGKTYRAPVSKNYIAIQDINKPHEITLFDTRHCDTAFGSEVSMRRSFADSGTVVTAGWADGNLVVASGFLDGPKLASRRDYWLAQPQKERRTRAVDEPQLEAGSYDNMIRNDQEYAQRIGRETLARTLNRDLNDIKVHLSNRGQEATTEQVLQFAGIGAHTISTQGNETLGTARGAEIVVQTKFHTVVAFQKDITVDGKRHRFETVAALPRSEIYLANEQREPKVGDKIVVSYESGMLKTCELFDTHAKAIQNAEAVLGDARQRPNYVSSRQSEIDRSASMARLAVAIAARHDLVVDVHQRMTARDIEHLNVVDLNQETGLYTGQCFRVRDTIALEHPDRAKDIPEHLVVQLISDHDYVVHDQRTIDAPLDQGGKSTITYHSGSRPCRTANTTLDDLRRELTKGREIHEPAHDRELGLSR